MANTVLAGRYELIREIGRGASATVYLAHDRTLGRDIAIKLVAPALANDLDFVDRFLREARLSAGLSHPNIVAVHDVGESDDHRPFLAISLVDGASLEQVISKSAPLPIAEATRILGQLASALDYLHLQGLIHRDVKPSNVLIEESGRVLLSDFGIAYARESARYTATGMLLGTPRYMAPEQMRGEEPTPQTDVYAMGVLAFEMLAGAPPFEGTGTGLMYRIVHEQPPLLRTLAPGVAPGIEAVIARALEKDPAARWNSPGDFAAAFASPDANATFAGPVAAMAVGEASVSDAAPSPPPTEEVPANAPDESPSLAVADSGSDGAGGSGRKRTVLGAGALGALGLAVASYCLVAGGDSDHRANAGLPSPTASATPVGSPAPSPGASVTAAATASATAPSTPTTAATPGGIVPQPTATPVSQATASPVPTSTSTVEPSSTPQPTATNSATATATATPTQTPSPTPTATATLAPPNAPSNVSRAGNTLTWSDNSNNESGFRIYWRAKDINTQEVYTETDATVGPNTTTTQVKTVNLVATTTDFRRGVAAYNAAGQSAIAWEP